MSFERLVVGTDGGDTASVAVAQTLGLADRTGAEVIVVTAHGKGDDAREVARSLLRDVKRQHPGVERMELVARQGDPVEALIGVAKDRDADLVVVGNRGLTGKRVLGGIPDRVSHQCPTSVLIADTNWAAILPAGEDPHARRAPAKVLIATDGSPTANAATRAGFGLASALDAETLLLFVGERGHGERVLEKATLDLAKDTPVRTLVEGGDPPSRILEVAEQENADLIVVGNKGMRGLRRMFLGGVPNHVTHHAPCSVLVVKTS